MTCQVELIADCGDTLGLARALFITDCQDANWLLNCSVSLSSCGNLLAVAYNNRLCLLTSQWISSTNSVTYIISWSGTLTADVSVVLVLPIYPSQHYSQNGPDWFCIIVGFKNGNIGFYTNTGHLLLLEKLDEKPVMKISCHTGTYGTLPDDIYILFQNCQCIISGSNLFQVLRNAKLQIAKVEAGIENQYTVDSRSINIQKWIFSDQEVINDAASVGLELKNTYDHLLAASTYGGYETWYRSVPPVNTLTLGAGVKPFVGFHYALEGGTTPPLQDVARAVAIKIKSALPGWLGGGSTETAASNPETFIKSEPLSMRCGLYDAQRHGASVAVSPDRRLAAFVDTLGRVSVLDVRRGHLIRLFKGYRDAQCAFMQIFEQDNKKQHLTTIKEKRRAIFLIIYNPKKGLVDIRLMQKGSRVAVFTATKNGLLIYNTCGLVGADKSYTHKKLNLPEFQCVLLDPDGRLKKFNIPFFYALEGEHSSKSKDLYILRKLRDYMKSNSNVSDSYKEEIIKQISELKTLELKKHVIEQMIRHYDVPSQIVVACVNTFWNAISKNNLTPEEESFKDYLVNLILVTLFYRRISNEACDDIVELMSEVDVPTPQRNSDTVSSNDSVTFQLLQDDNCILERLLILAEEINYKEHEHAKVTFAENNLNSYKQFVSCFVLDKNSKYLLFKSEMSNEQLQNISAYCFKSITSMPNLNRLSYYLEESKIDPKEILRLLIMHLMNMSLENINVELIEKVIQVVYYICETTEEAVNIVYNEISPWWQSIRDMLVDMPCPLRSMIVAMVCKAVGRLFEMKSSGGEEDAWVSVTKENAKWGILIGKLEDISILSIVLLYKDYFEGDSLPRLQFADININLKYIYLRGKGSVTELISKWLCSMGVSPEAIITNELIDTKVDDDDDDIDSDDESNPSRFFVDNNRISIDKNPKIFKWLSLLRRQFPLSTSCEYIIANMCWEYAMAWQKDTKKVAFLSAVLSCLRNVTDLHLRLGLFSIIWATYLKHSFEVTCRLVNKVGRLPKDPLCLQDVGLAKETLVEFLKITNQYLEKYLECSKISIGKNKSVIRFEKIWDESMPSLVEVAQDSKKVNQDILALNYQLSCTIYYLCHFNIKFSKPLDILYDIDYQYICEALAGNVHEREINIQASEKVRNPRMKFITKVIRAAIETITCSENSVTYKLYQCEECTRWIENVSYLADLWGIENDFILRQQIIGLYHLGYDTLAEKVIADIKNPESLLTPLLAITIQRLKRCLEHSSNQHEWIVTIPPHLYKRLQSTAIDSSIPAHPSLETTIAVLQQVLYRIDCKESEPSSDKQNIKLAELIIDTCQALLRRKL